MAAEIKENSINVPEAKFLVSIAHKQSIKCGSNFRFLILLNCPNRKMLKLS